MALKDFAGEHLADEGEGEGVVEGRAEAVLGLNGVAVHGGASEGGDVDGAGDGGAEDASGGVGHMNVFVGEGGGVLVGVGEGLVDGDALPEAFHADVADGLFWGVLGGAVIAADGHGDDFDLVVVCEFYGVEIVAGCGFFVEEEGEVGVDVSGFIEESFFEFGVLGAECGEEFAHGGGVDGELLLSAGVFFEEFGQCDGDGHGWGALFGGVRGVLCILTGGLRGLRGGEWLRLLGRFGRGCGGLRVVFWGSGRFW